MLFKEEYIAKCVLADGVVGFNPVGVQSENI